MNSQRPKIKVVISGGGTGGHIFPAVSIAQTLMSMNPDNEMLFVGAKGRMEMEKVPASGFRIIGLDIAGLQRRLSLSNLLLPFKIFKSIIAARKIIKEFKPDVAVGVGGYASGPTLFAASGVKVPCLIQEQNSFAGITNRLLAGRVKEICVAYEGMDRYFPKEKLKMTGNPVRKDLLDLSGKREQGLALFGLSPYRPVILVIGGSLGARTINRAIAEGIDSFSKEDVQVLWQTGRAGHAEATSKAQRYENMKVHEFISRIDLAYSVADIVISRAGASSVSELAIVGKPSILVPSPNVAEDHQTKNAKALVDKKAACMIDDSEASGHLVSSAIALLRDEVLKDELSKNISAMALPDAAVSIAEEVYKLALSKG
ncbi:MAG: undecaprenyldiphospho-muramoylpentapeptide beta-N-acetylglucosaminyltransferase [Bacteroidota bacterium]